MKDLCRPQAQKPGIESYTSLCNLMVSGSIPLSVQPYLAGAALSAFKKKDGGIRPVASGDPLRRTTGRSAARAVKQKAIGLFFPLQVGVGVSCGIDMVVHSLRYAQERFRGDPRYALLKGDLRNAHNEFHRTLALSECFEKFPELYSLCWWLYGNPSLLFLLGSDWKIISQQGGQQGCPLVGLLFALVWLTITKKIQSECPDLVVNISFADDLNLFGDIDDLNKAWKIILKEGPKVGCYPNPSKSQLAGMDALPVDHALLGYGFELYPDSNFDTLGSPIGDAIYCNNWSKKKSIPKMTALAKYLPNLPVQVSFLLLRYCLSYCRAVFFLRTIPVNYLDDFCAQFDSLVLKMFSSIFPFQLNNLARIQIGLGTRKLPGLGIRQCNLHHPAAYSSSLNFCLKSMRILIGNEDLAPPIHLKIAVDLLNTRIDPNKVLALENSQPQKKLSRWIDKKLYSDLLVSSDLRSKARLQCLSVPGCNSFLDVLPIDAYGLRLSDDEWSISVARLLGSKIFPPGVRCPARSCSKPIDVFGDHCLLCPCRGSRILRHNALVNNLVALIRSAKISVVKEPSDVLRNDTKQRPADFLIRDYPIGFNTAFDLAVTSGLQIKYIDQSSNNGSYAVDHYATSVKQPKYRDAVLKIPNLKFDPVIFECFGGCNYSTDSLIRYIAKKTQLEKDSSFAQELTWIRQRLSVTLQRHNARMVLSRRNQNQFPGYFLEDDDDFGDGEILDPVLKT